MIRWTPLIGAALALGLATAAEQAPAADPAPPVATPLPFDHPQHARALRKAGVACVDCHPVGLRVGQPPATAAPPAPPVPLESCHGCHLGELPGATRRAPRDCGACHPVRESLLPTSHDPHWDTSHGDAARAPGRSCDDCHARRWCIDCHDDRGPLSRTPHPPGFRATHGVEARVDPASCSTCHAGPTCQTCHATGSLPW